MRVALVLYCTVSDLSLAHCLIRSGGEKWAWVPAKSLGVQLMSSRKFSIEFSYGIPKDLLPYTCILKSEFPQQHDQHWKFFSPNKVTYRVESAFLGCMSVKLSRRLIYFCPYRHVVGHRGFSEAQPDGFQKTNTLMATITG
jgi:hypothetical protein